MNDCKNDVWIAGEEIYFNRIGPCPERSKTV